MQKSNRSLLLALIFMMLFAVIVIVPEKQAYAETDWVEKTLKENIYPQLNKELKKDKVNIISWDADLEYTVNIVLEKYPELKSKVNFINLGVASEYATKAFIEILNGKYNGYTMIFPADINYVEEMNKLADPLDKIGYKASDYANSYDFIRQMSTVNGKLRSVCVQLCPNCFIYNTSIAKKVLGTDDPAKVQEMISTPAKFNKVAAKMKENGYYMTSSVNKSFMTGASRYSSYPLNIHKVMCELLNKYDGDKYDNGAEMWADKWCSGVTNGTVFGYFGTNWMESVFKGYGAKDGEYKMCEGPVSYMFGGTFLYAKDTGTQGAYAAKFLSALTSDEKLGIEISKRKADVINNSAVNKKLAADSSMNSEFYKQNTYAVWHSAALALGGGSSASKTTGWQKEAGKWYYYDNNGSKVTGWQMISNHWYFFNKSTGAMLTGWQKISGKWYYFKNGIMQNSWTKIKNKWYYFKNGVMKTGWMKSGTKWYYFNSDGSMVTGNKKIGGKTYKFNSSGVCLNP